MNLHAINPDQGLYVMKSGPGFSCYGFEVLDRKARAIAAWAGLAPPRSAPGTREHFEECNALMDAGRAHAERTRTRCPAELCAALVGLEGRRVEVSYYGQRVRFNVGKSTGWMPVHLRVHNSTSRGGMALSAGEIADVRVIR